MRPLSFAEQDRRNEKGRLTRKITSYATYVLNAERRLVRLKEFGPRGGAVRADPVFRDNYARCVNDIRSYRHMIRRYQAARAALDTTTETTP